MVFKKMYLLYINNKKYFKNVAKYFEKHLHSIYLCVTISVLICVEVVDGYAKT